MTEQSVTLTTPNEEIRKIKPTKKRVWEVDALRGFLILLVTIDHFFYTAAYMPIQYATEAGEVLRAFSIEWIGVERINIFGQIRGIIYFPSIVMFVFVAGMSSSLTKSNFMRAVKMAGFSLAFTFATYVSQEGLGYKNTLVAFNIIHVITTCVFVWAFLDWIYSRIGNNHAKNAYMFGILTLAVLCIICGYYFRANQIEEPLTFFQSIFVKNTSLTKYSPADLQYLLPHLGWFLLGVCASKVLYSEKKTRFPTVNEKVFAPLTWCGRYCIFIYFGATIVYYGIFYLLCEIMKIL